MNPANQEKTILDTIKKIRRNKGYSQQYMAMKMGVEQSTYNKLEGGKSSLRIIHLLEICKILEIDSGQIMNLTTKSDKSEIRRVFSDIEGLLSELKKISFL